jgi:hypothetical protein
MFEKALMGEDKKSGIVAHVNCMEGTWRAIQPYVLISCVQQSCPHQLHLIFAGEYLLTEVQIPPVEIVETSRLTVDQNNPNRMSKAQMQGLKASIKQYGFIIPVVTNKDLMIADGEQRWTVAKELGLQKIPIVRLPLEDVDRRTLRQVLNKLKGEHDQKLDALEFQRIIQAGGKDDLKTLLAISDSSIQVMLKRLDEEDGQGVGGLDPTFEVVVSCKSEEEQKQAFEDLKQRGYTCRLLTL